jgi:hypothetical protein
MPLVDLPSLNPALPVTTPPRMALTPGALGEDEPVRPGFGALAEAAFEQENVIASAMASAAWGADNNPDDNYSGWDSIKGTKYEPYFGRFAGLVNGRQDAAVKADIDREEDNRNIIEAAPLWQSMPLILGAAVLDTTILLPGGAFVRGAKGGLAVSRTALNVAGATGAAVAVQEVGLHVTQQTRTVEESLINVSASAVLGGLLGAGGTALLSKAEWNGLTRTLERELNAPEGRTVPTPRTGISYAPAVRIDGKIYTGGSHVDAIDRAAKSLDTTVDDLLERFGGEENVFDNLDGFVGPDGFITRADAYAAVSGDEKIKSAAIRTGGQVFEGTSHAAAIAKAEAELGIKIDASKGTPEELGGFITTSGRWVSREDALEIARSADQIKAGREANRLLAEDVRFAEGVPVQPELPGTIPGPIAGSVGAAAADRSSLDALSIAGRAAGTTAKATAFLNPGQRLMQAEIPEVRNFYMRLGEMTQYIRGNDDGLPTPIAVETLRQEHDAGLMRAVVADRDSWGRYKQRMGKSRLGREQFDDEVGKAMRRGDEHEIPEVAEAAKAYRRDVYDPLLKAAQETGQLPEDIAVETATSYLSRVYKRKAIEADEVNFKNAVSQWVIQSSPRWMQDFDAASANKLAKLQDKVANASDAGKEAAERALRDLETELRIEREARFGEPEAMRARSDEIADEVFQKVTGRWVDPDTVPGRVTVEARGPMKARTFNMPDELLEPWLESNAQLIARRYHRLMSADVELAKLDKSMGGTGSPTLAAGFKVVRDGYARARNGVTDEKKLQRLAKNEKAAVRDLEGIRDILRGTYRMNDWEHNFGRMARLSNMFNYIRLMGQVTLASVPEAYRTAMVHGLRPFVETSMLALRQAEGFKMGVKEAKDAGNISERALSHRLATLAEIGDFYTTRTPVEKFMGNMTEVASTWNGIRIWTDTMRSIAAVATENRIMGTALKFDTASAVNKRYLAWAGIDQSMAERIAKQFDEFGESVDGVHVANAETWTDEQAKRSFRAALNKDVDTQVVTKSVADIPLFANTPLGRVLFQFNSFNLASHQRVLLRGLQEGPARFVSGMIAMTSMGMLVTYLQALSSNRAGDLPDFAENPGWWIAEGLDKSGLAMVPLQMSNAMELLTGINPVKAPLTMFDEQSAQSSRLRNRNMMSALGPTVGLLEDIGKVGGIAGSLARGDEITRGQGNAAKRMLPFNSYVGMRQMLQWVVDPPTN